MLSSLIGDPEAQNSILGTSVCRGAPSVSHLLFADDCFLFFRAKVEQAQIMKDIL